VTVWGVGYRWDCTPSAPEPAARGQGS
jgi:hypothetical protein